MIADARTARPGVFVVSTGRCGSTMLSNMLRLNPEILSLSEFFSLLMPDPLPAGELDAAAERHAQPRDHLVRARAIQGRVHHGTAAGPVGHPDATGVLPVRTTR